MSEQTANLCTTDAAESLRAVVAERDREIERLKEGQSILILARDEQKRLANEYRDLWSRAALKAQPSGVVHHNLIEALKFYANGDHLLLADPDAWDTCSGEPINFLHDDAGTASVEDGSIAKAALDSLNSSPVSAGDVLTSSECACGDQYPANSYGAGFMAANNGVCENCDASAPSHGEQVRHMVLAGWKLVPVEPTPEMISAAEEAHMPFGDMDIALRCALFAAPSAGSQEQGE